MYKHIAIGNNIKQLIIFMVSLTLLLIVYTPSYAQVLPKQNLRISPIIQNLQLMPGTTITIPVTIENLADKPMGIHIDVLPFDPSNPEQALSPIANKSLVSWTSLSEKDILLPEREQRTIFVSISVPKTALGGYYETLAYTPFISGEQTVHSPIILSKFLGFIFATAGENKLADAVKEIKVVDFSPQQYILDHGIPTIQFRVKNNYKTHVIGKPFLTITPLFGTPAKVQLEEKYLFPTETRDWKTSVPLPMNIFYRATLTLSIGQGNTTTAHTWFILLPYKMVLAGIVGALLILIALLRKRLFKALFVLFHG